ncbi:MAG TPA: hypothetical protein VE714_05825 [Gemmatimonadales bacterium]|jgi:hypothetical protein|nr:hypothetical protein [Gemmatimonadales bacterium]
MMLRSFAILLLANALGGRLFTAPVPQPDAAREALNLGRTHDQGLYDAFNAGYRLTPSGIVDSVEVVTEFRRAVLIVREHALQGEYSFTANDLASALAPFRGTVTFIAQVRLHPLNTYAAPPAYDLYVRTGSQSKPVAAPAIKRDPVYPPGSIGPGSSGSVMTAVRLEASFARADIVEAAEPTLIVNDDHGAILWQSRIDLGRYR